MAASAVALGLVAAPVMAQDARAIRAAEQVRDQALKGNIALDYVTQITTRFGPRPAGSRAEQDASAWAADYMRAHGFQNVRIEQFPLIGWERGEESAEILGARPQKLVVAALGHSISTPAEGVEADVVFFDGLDALMAAPAGSLSGKIVVVDGGQMVRMQDGSGYGPLSRIRGVGPTEAAKRGAVAFVMRSAGSDEHRMPHTGTTRYVEGKVPLPAFALSAPDADQVARLVGMGETVRLRLKSTARTYETVSQNVIGDIVGASRPDEIIVLGSHMDSWDLGTGAIDDAAGGGAKAQAGRGFGLDLAVGRSSSGRDATGDDRLAAGRSAQGFRRIVGGGGGGGPHPARFDRGRDCERIRQVQRRQGQRRRRLRIAREIEGGRQRRRQPQKGQDLCPEGLHTIWPPDPGAPMDQP